MVLKKNHKIDKGDRGIYDKRNKINNLTGKEWLKFSKSVWISQKSAVDKDAFEHPAPFLVEDVKKLILLFTKKGDKVLDPFMGSGTTILASVSEQRKGIGIDLNKEYIKLAKKRLKKIKADSKKIKIINGDSLKKIKTLDPIDYCVTSPPYHNILKNKGNGIRHDGNQKRQGVEYYSDDDKDVGNKETYASYVESVKEIMSEIYKKLKIKKYCTIIISDFTVEKQETNAHGDMIRIMQEIGFELSGNTILVQDSKPLYPFGYPYAYKINHVHQYLLTFRKI
jgi:DNA modification methylase